MTEPPRAAEERLAFDQVPDVYDRVRPSYPEALFDELFAYLRLDSPIATVAVFEVGPGTGKATRSLLERGAHVVAVEIGPSLAAFLERKLSLEFPAQLRVINSSFEAYDVERQTFDLVVSATAFHWIDPAIRLRKSRDLLHAGGALAIIGTNQIRSDVDCGYFERTFPIYRRYRPEEKHAEVPGEDVVPPEYAELKASGLFDAVALHRYRWDQTYATADYADLVRSYANTQTMEPGPREALIADLCRIIDTEYGGSVTRPLVVTLTLGRRPN